MYVAIHLRIKINVFLLDRAIILIASLNCNFQTSYFNWYMSYTYEFKYIILWTRYHYMLSSTKAPNCSSIYDLTIRRLWCQVSIQRIFYCWHFMTMARTASTLKYFDSKKVSWIYMGRCYHECFVVGVLCCVVRFNLSRV